jgi:hypothetical protein
MWRVQEHDGGGGTSKGQNMLQAEPDAMKHRESVSAREHPISEGAASRSSAASTLPSVCGYQPETANVGASRGTTNRAGHPASNPADPGGGHAYGKRDPRIV